MMPLLKRTSANVPASPALHADHTTFPQCSPQTDDVMLVERVRLKIRNCHVFKLPPKPDSGGWRGADWRDKVWQGNLKVVERGDETAVLLVDPTNEKNIFAVCPIRHNDNFDGTNSGNGVDRCIDSSRYFVLKIQNGQGRTLFIGLAFNERADAFDFNTALEDSRREKLAERKASQGISHLVQKQGVNYKMKEGEKIKVAIPSTNSSAGSSEETSPTGESKRAMKSAATRRLEARKSRGAGSLSSSGFLKPSSRDTPSRIK